MKPTKYFVPYSVARSRYKFLFRSSSPFLLLISAEALKACGGGGGIIDAGGVDVPGFEFVDSGVAVAGGSGGVYTISENSVVEAPSGNSENARYFLGEVKAPGSSTTLSFTISDESLGVLDSSPTAGKPNFFSLYLDIVGKRLDLEVGETISFTVTVTLSGQGIEDLVLNFELEGEDVELKSPDPDVSGGFLALQRTYQFAENSEDPIVEIYVADGVTYSITGDDSNLFTIDQITGEIKFINPPDYEARDSYTLTLNAAVSGSDTVSQTIMVQITDVAEAPVIQGDGIANIGNIVKTAAGGASKDINIDDLLGKFLDDDDDIISITFTSIPTGISLSYDDSGSDVAIVLGTSVSLSSIINVLSLTIDSSVVAGGQSYDIEYTVIDGAGFVSELATLRFSLFDAGANLPPTILDDGIANIGDIVKTATGDTGKDINIDNLLGEFVDDNNDIVSITFTSIPQGISLSYDDSGSDITIVLGTSVSLSSIIGNMLSLTIVSSVVAAGQSYNVEYIVSDGDGLSSVAASLRFNLLDNIALSPEVNSYTELNNLTVSGNVTDGYIVGIPARDDYTSFDLVSFDANDPDGDNAQIRFAISGSDSDYFSISSDGGVLSFTGNADAKDSYQIRILVTDVDGLVLDFGFTVNSIDSPPEIVIAPDAGVSYSDQTFSFREKDYSVNAKVLGIVTGTDPESVDGIIYTIIDSASDDPTAFTIDRVTGLLSFVADGTYNLGGDNSYSVRIGVTEDGDDGTSSYIDISVDIQDVNYSPVRVPSYQQPVQAPGLLFSSGAETRAPLTLNSLLGVYDDPDDPDDPDGHGDIVKIEFITIPAGITIYYTSSDGEQSISSPGEILISSIVGDNIMVARAGSVPVGDYIISYNVIDTGGNSASDNAEISVSVASNVAPFFDPLSDADVLLIDNSPDIVGYNLATRGFDVNEGDYSTGSGLRLGIFSATDSDGTATSITYSIKLADASDPNTAGASSFSIDAVTGELSFIGNVDADVANFDGVYTVTIVATENPGTTISGEAVVSVAIQDIYDMDPTSVSVSATTVDEDVSADPNGYYFVAMVDVVDSEDDLSPVYTYTLGGADALKFTIEGVDLYLKEQPDYELGLTTYAISIRVDVGVDGISTNYFVDSGPITITVENVVEDTEAEFAPIYKYPFFHYSVGYADKIEENTPAGTKLYQFTSFDESVLPGDAITYSIKLGPNSDLFTIDINTGILSFARSPDYKEQGSGNIYDITVIASSGLDETRSTVRVEITGLREVASDISLTSAIISESVSSVAVGDSIYYEVADISVTDEDEYNLYLGDFYDNDLFYIDSSNEKLYLKNKPDHARKSEYQVFITVAEGTGSFVARYDELFTITVAREGVGPARALEDVNIGRVVLSDTSIEVSFEQLAALFDKSTTSITITGISAFTSITDDTVVSVSSDVIGGDLQIDDVLRQGDPSVDLLGTGAIGQTDLVGGNVVEITYTASDGVTGSSKEGSLIFEVAASKVNSLFFYDSPTNQDNSIKEIIVAPRENVATGTVVADVNAVYDGDDTLSISYELVDDYNYAGLFAIDPSSGEVTLEGTFNYELKKNYDLTVKATAIDSGAYGYIPVSVNVADVNDIDVVVIREYNVGYLPIGGDYVSVIPIGQINTFFIEAAAAATFYGIEYSIFQHIYVNDIAVVNKDSNSNSHVFSAGVTTASDGSVIETINVTLQLRVREVPNDNPLYIKVVASGALATGVGVGDVVTIPLKSWAYFNGGIFSYIKFTLVATGANVNRSPEFVDSVNEQIWSLDTVTLPEDTQPGDLATVYAVDPEDVPGAVPATIIYSLVNDYDGLFAVDASGVVTLEGTLDYEKATNHYLVVKAAESADAGLYSYLRLDVVVEDVLADNPSLIDAAPDATVVYNSPLTLSLTIAELADSLGGSAATSIKITQISVSRDGIVLLDSDVSLTYGSADTLVDIGVLIPKSTDSLTITFLPTDKLQDGDLITVTYVDDDDAGTFASKDLLFQFVGISSLPKFQDAEDNLIFEVADSVVDPLLFYDSATDPNSATKPNQIRGITVAFSENLATAGTVVADINAVYNGDIAVPISYELVDNYAGLFSIDPSSGVVTLTGTLDYELKKNYDLTVKATEIASGADNHISVRVNVRNVRDADDVVIDEISVGYLPIGGTPVLAIPINQINTLFIADYSGFFTQSGVIYVNDVEVRDNLGGIPLSFKHVGVVRDNGDIAINVSSTNSNDNINVKVIASGDLVAGDVVKIFVNPADFDDFTVTTLESYITFTVVAAGAAVNLSPEFVDSPTDLNPNRIWSQTVSLSEDVPSATEVATVTAVDPESVATITYELVDNYGDLFAIDASSGVVTLAGTLDYEKATQYYLVVKATEAAGTNVELYSYLRLDVVVDDVVDTPPLIDIVPDGSIVYNSPLSFDIAQLADSLGGSAATGIKITQISVNRDDIVLLDSDVSITYGSAESITSVDIDRLIPLSADSLTITLLPTDKLQEGDLITITYADDDDAGTFASNNLLLQVDVVDLFEFQYEQGKQIYSISVSISENSPDVSHVTTVKAVSLSEVATITYELVNDYDGLFVVDPSSGEVTIVNPEIDYEIARAYALVVKAVEDGNQELVSYLVVNVDIVDVNEISSSIFAYNLGEGVIQYSSSGLGILETAPLVDVESEQYYLIADIANDDPDTTDNFTDNIISLTGADADKFAFINDKLYLTSKPYYQELSSYDVSIVVYDSKDKSFRGNPLDLNIAVTDIQERPLPIVTSVDVGYIERGEQSRALSIKELVSYFSDADSDLTSGTTRIDFGVNNVFVSDSGESLQGIWYLFDQEEANYIGGIDTEVFINTDNLLYGRNYSFGYSLIDSEDNASVGRVYLVVNTAAKDTGVANLPPEFQNLVGGAIYSIQADGIYEADNVNLEIATVTAVDPEGVSTTIAYSLVDDYDGLFSVDPVSGAVTLVGDLDYETVRSYTIVIKAVEGSGADAQASHFVVSFDVLDVNEMVSDIVFAEIDPVPTTISIYETQKHEDVDGNQYYLISYLNVVDPDINSDFRGNLLSLQSGYRDNDSFAIIDNKLYLTSILDFETKSSYSIEIVSRDADLVYSKTLTIEINDVNEPPVIREDFGGELGVIVKEGGTNIPGRDLTTQEFLAGFSDPEDGDTGFSKITITSITAITAKSGTNAYLLSADDVKLSYTPTPTGSPVVIIDAVDVAGENDNSDDVDIIVANVNNIGISIAATVPDDTYVTIKYKVSDSQGEESSENSLSFVVGTAIDNPPVFDSNIDINNANIDENDGTGKLLATVRATDPETIHSISYSLETHTTLFSVGPNTAEVKVKASALGFNFEEKSEYKLIIVATESGSGYSFVSKYALIVNVNDVNETPTDITLSNLAISEDASSETVTIGGVVTQYYLIGEIRVDDPDVSNSAFSNNTIELSGNGDGSDFAIIDNKLYLISAPDFEATPTGYSIEIVSRDITPGDPLVSSAATDPVADLVYSKTFIIEINDVNEPPSTVNPAASSNLVNGSIDENVNGGTVLYAFNSVDPDGDTVMYRFATDADFTYDGLFVINTNSGELALTSFLDFEAENAPDNNIYMFKVEAYSSGSDGVEQTSIPVIVYIQINDVDDDIYVDTTKLLPDDGTGASGDPYKIVDVVSIDASGGTIKLSKFLGVFIDPDTTPAFHFLSPENQAAYELIIALPQGGGILSITYSASDGTSDVAFVDDVGVTFVTFADLVDGLLTVQINTTVAKSEWYIDYILQKVGESGDDHYVRMMLTNNDFNPVFVEPSIDSENFVVEVDYGQVFATYFYAKDPDLDGATKPKPINTVTYSIVGLDSSQDISGITIDRVSGVLLVDETVSEGSYNIIVIAKETSLTDGSEGLSAVIPDVTIVVKGDVVIVDTAPKFNLPSYSVSIVEEQGDLDVFDLTTDSLVVDDEGHPIHFELSGVDAQDFEITGVDTGDFKVSFRFTPDYELPFDSDEDNVYEVEVIAISTRRDAGITYKQSASFDLTVNVTDVSEQAVFAGFNPYRKAPNSDDTYYSSYDNTENKYYVGTFYIDGGTEGISLTGADVSDFTHVIDDSNYKSFDLYLSSPPNLSSTNSVIVNIGEAAPIDINVIISPGIVEIIHPVEVISINEGGGNRNVKTQAVSGNINGDNVYNDKVVLSGVDAKFFSTSLDLVNDEITIRLDEYLDYDNPISGGTGVADNLYDITVAYVGTNGYEEFNYQFNVDDVGAVNPNPNPVTLITDLTDTNTPKSGRLSFLAVDGAYDGPDGDGFNKTKFNYLENSYGAIAKVVFFFGNFDTENNYDEAIGYLEYTISNSGANNDVGFFKINKYIGELYFKHSPDYERPLDTGQDNSYIVELGLRWVYHDGGTKEVLERGTGNSITHTVTVNVTNDSSEDSSDPSLEDSSLTFVSIAKEKFIVRETESVDTPIYTPMIVHVISSVLIDDPVVTYSLTNNVDSFGVDNGLFNINPDNGEITFRQATNYGKPSDQDQDNLYQITIKVTDGGLVDYQNIVVQIINDASNDYISNIILSSNQVAETDTPDNVAGGVFYEVGNVSIGTDYLGEYYYIIGGENGADFMLSNDKLYLRHEPDYDQISEYIVGITAVSVGILDTVVASHSKSFVINVVNDNDNPVFVDDVINVQYLETRTDAVGTYTATLQTDSAQDASISYRLADGGDAQFFNIGSGGALTFKQQPDYNTPSDGNDDNIYEVDIVAVSTQDGSEDILKVNVQLLDDAAAVTSLGLDTTGVAGYNIDGVSYILQDSHYVQEGSFFYYDFGKIDLAYLGVVPQNDPVLEVIAQNSDIFYVSPQPDGTQNLRARLDSDSGTAKPLIFGDYQIKLANNNIPQGTVIEILTMPDIVSGQQTLLEAEDIRKPLKVFYFTQDPSSYVLSGADAQYFYIDEDNYLILDHNPETYQSLHEGDYDARYQVEVRDALDAPVDSFDFIVEHSVELYVEKIPADQVQSHDIILFNTEILNRPGLDVLPTYSISSLVGSASIDQQSGNVIVSITGASVLQTSFTITSDTPEDSLLPYDKLSIVVNLYDDFVLDITAPAPKFVAVNENQDANIPVATVIANTDSASIPVTYSLAGADESEFTIDQDGNIYFRSTRNYETPQDVDYDNYYELYVVAKATNDDGFSKTKAQEIFIEVRNVNETQTYIDDAPYFDYLVGYSNLIEIVENSRFNNDYITIPSLSDYDDALPSNIEYRYAETGDYRLLEMGIFTFDETSRQLRLEDGIDLDYEKPIDQNRDNIYKFEFIASVRNYQGVISEYSNYVFVSVSNVIEGPVAKPSNPFKIVDASAGGEYSIGTAKELLSQTIIDLEEGRGDLTSFKFDTAVEELTAGGFVEVEPASFDETSVFRQGGIDKDFDRLDITSLEPIMLNSDQLRHIDPLQPGGVYKIYYGLTDLKSNIVGERAYILLDISNVSDNPKINENNNKSQINVADLLVGSSIAEFTVIDADIASVTVKAFRIKQDGTVEEFFDQSNEFSFSYSYLSDGSVDLSLVKKLSFDDSYVIDRDGTAKEYKFAFVAFDLQTAYDFNNLDDSTNTGNINSIDDISDFQYIDTGSFKFFSIFSIFSNEIQLEIDVNEGEAGVIYHATGGSSYEFVGAGLYSIFNLDKDSGELSFKQAPDFENPHLLAPDNVYDVNILSKDVSGNDLITHLVTVNIIRDDVVFDPSLSQSSSFYIDRAGDDVTESSYFDIGLWVDGA